MLSKKIFSNRKIILWFVLVILMGIIVFFYSPVLASEDTPPSEGWIAFVGEDGNIWLIHPDGNGSMRITNDSSRDIQYLGLKWSPDGIRISFLRRSLVEKKYILSLLVYNVYNSETLEIVSNITNSYDWSPNGDILAFVKINDPQSETDRRLTIFNLNTQEIKEIVGGVSNSIAWSPDGSQIAFDRPYELKLDCEGCGTFSLVFYDGIWSYDFSTGNPGLIVPPSYGPLVIPRWSPSSRFIGFSGVPLAADPMPPTLTIFDLKNPERGFIGFGESCNWSPTEELIACSDARSPGLGDIQEPCSIGIYSLETGNLISQIPTYEKFCDYKPLWSPNGQNLAVYSFFTNPDTQELTEAIFLMHPDEFRRSAIGNGYPLGWSPDSRWVVITRENHLFTIDTNSGKEFSLAQGNYASWQPQQVLHPPKAITDLKIFPDKESETKNALRLVWTKPIKDPLSESLVLEYDMRFSNKPINESNWEQTEKLSNQTIVDDSGSEFVWSVIDSRLTLNHEWYFVIKSRYTNSDWSGISNVPLYIDSGFRPIVNGYSFSNTSPLWGHYPDYPADQDFRLEDMFTMFGKDACVSPFDTGSCQEYNGAAIVFHWWVNNMTLGVGHCTGMTVSSWMIFQDPSELDRSDVETVILN